MKILLTIGIVFLTLSVCAQSPGEQVAAKIAKKMKDSLALTEEQRVAIYDINMQMHNKKMPLFIKYKGTDSLRILLQRIENSRDTLYSAVLPPEKYLLYKQKKTVLVYDK
ncbi:hypothetical protein HHL16_23590 [Pseudoflavitalea sp. G-6-1-2]|uniref:hypothetical protein n=1 Tax=Pseudoflavitalea sp. G-6-1-2 TaxID=2728841 RepID=UPI00146C430C|nr:hypothetical protein [Pseudoflavitalea sp. G-6-1-2]NML23884.1 hypothetical protein [Pseudoflavitalea sp. G-6-1-2]